MVTLHFVKSPIFPRRDIISPGRSTMKKNVSSSNKTRSILNTALIGMGLVVVFVLSACQFLQNDLYSATATPMFPTLLVPTPDCGPPTLVLGSMTLQMETLTLAPDGSVTVPSNTPGVAYWVEGTDLQYIFMLSPTPENRALFSTLPAGSTAKATWSNCNSMTFVLSAPQPRSFGPTYLPEQSTTSIAIYLQTDAASEGLVVSGELTEEQITTINTPAAGASDIQAEISLLETTASPDGTTVRIGISIQNYGAAALTLSAGDISLTEQDSTSLVMVSSEPPLPKVIAPGALETIYLVFPRPASPGATLKVFEVEYELEGY